jgi:sugar phosphate isomerase/epimerase
MKTGICMSPESLGAIPQPAFEFVEANVQAFLKPEQPDDAFEPNRKRAASLPLPVLAANCFLPGDLRVTGPGIDFTRLEHYAEVAFRRAVQIGIGVIVFGSGGARKLPDGVSRKEGLAQFIEANRRIAPFAERHGVTVVIEPLNRAECNFINSLADGAEVVEAVNHPRIRLLADFFHMLREEESSDEIRRFGHLLHHAHLAEKAERTPPGIKGDDFRPFLAALRAVGYDRLISIEANWKSIPDEQAAAVTEVRRQLAEA